MAICLHGYSGIADPDVWWHLRTGEWILSRRAVPVFDVFGTFSTPREWEDYSWLFEVVLFKFYQHHQLIGVVAFTAGAASAITAALYRLIRRYQSDVTKAVLLTMVALIAMSRLFTPRPWLLTILFFVIEMNILMNVRKAGAVRVLLWLPALFVLWANTHIQFINGLLVLGVAALEPLIVRRTGGPEPQVRARVLWAILGSCIVGTLLNPYGWKIYKAAYHLVSQDGVYDRISELQAIPFRQCGEYVFLFLTLAAVRVLAMGRHFQPFETTLLALAAVLSFRSQRDVWFMTIVAVAIVAGAARDDRPEMGHPMSWWAVLTAIVTAGLVILGTGIIMHVGEHSLERRVADNLPVNAVQMIKERGYAGPLFNSYDWGGFLIWSLRVPVAIDGRASLYGDQRIERSIATWSGEPGWESDPQLSCADLVVGPVKAPLIQLLRMDRRFQLMFEDHVAAVFVARNAAKGLQTLARTPANNQVSSAEVAGRHRSSKPPVVLARRAGPDTRW